MAETRSLYNVLVVIFAALGSMTFGFSLTILSSQGNKPAFLEYFDLDLVDPDKIDHSNAIIAAFNCLLFVGGWFGSLAMGTLADRFGRRMAIAIGAGLTVVGGGLQAGSVAQSLFCVTRVITGLGVGILLGAVPLFQAEIAPPHFRGLMVGSHGAFLGVGLAIAQWISLAFYNVNGQATWRGPLAIQCLFPLILLCGVFSLPESPRYYPKDPDDTFARQEYALMKAQMDMEAESTLTVWQMLKAPSMRKRLILGFITMLGGQLTGVLVIGNYGFIIYQQFGFSGIMIGVMLGLWATINPLGNFIGSIVTDRYGRVKVLVIGYATTAICLILMIILIALYGGTDNKAGNNACLFFIFFVVMTYTIGIEASSFVYAAEIFPTQVRSQGVSFSMSGLFIFATIFQASTAPALTAIGWKYYLIFACSCIVYAVAIAIWWPETRGFALEQIGAKFGDEVVDDKENSIGVVEVEHAHPEKSIE